MNPKTKQTAISEVNEVWSGINKYGKAETLYNVIDEDGWRYTTKNGAFYSSLIGKPITLQWDEVLSKNKNPKTGEPYINKYLVERSAKTAPKPNTTLEARIARIEKALQENGMLD